MSLTANVLYLSKNSDDSYLSPYIVLKQVPCCTGDRLALVLADCAIDNVEVLESTDCTLHNINMLYTKMWEIVISYNKYCLEY